MQRQPVKLTHDRENGCYYFASPDGVWCLQRRAFPRGKEPFWFKGYPFNWILWGPGDLVKPRKTFKRREDARAWLTERYGAQAETPPGGSEQ